MNSPFFCKYTLSVFLIFFLFLLMSPISSYSSVPIGEGFKLFGDFRFRMEFDNRSGEDILETPDKDETVSDAKRSRERARLRARFGGTYKAPGDNFSFSLRFATNSSGKNSPHENLATGGHALALDRAFFKFAYKKNISFTAGKQGYPFWQQTEQMWDEDIQPEGVALSYKSDVEDFKEIIPIPLENGVINFVFGYFYLNNEGWDTSFFANDNMMILQAEYKETKGSKRKTFALTYFTVNDLGCGVEDGCSDKQNNSLFDDVVFYQVSAQLKTKGQSPDWMVGLDYHMSNANDGTATWNGSEATIDDNSGYVVQGRVKLDKYDVRLYYYKVGVSSVPFYGDWVLAQDNFPNSSGSAPIGFTGYRAQIGYKFSGKISCDLRYYSLVGNAENYKTSYEKAFGVAEVSGRKITRIQFNFNLKF